MILNINKIASNTNVREEEYNAYIQKREHLIHLSKKILCENVTLNTNNSDTKKFHSNVDNKNNKIRNNKIRNNKIRNNKTGKISKTYKNNKNTYVCVNDLNTINNTYDTG